MNTLTGTESTDPVKTIKDALSSIKEQEALIETSMQTLTAKAMGKVLIAFGRVFGEAVEIPQGQPESAIPSSGDNLRIDFPVSSDMSLKTNTVIDSETGISFLGVKVDSPVA
ncbi:MAG: hypothetical protein ACOYN2_04225 [Patescibacteria group bacterium]